jgi:hypothetical protein
MNQTPKNPEKYKLMMANFRTCETKEDLRTATVMYVLDLSYDRSDIALALHDVEIEKGWH